MKMAGVRFTNKEYLNISITEDGIELYTIDEDGNKKEYTVTEKTEGRSRKGKE